MPPENAPALLTTLRGWPRSRQLSLAAAAVVCLALFAVLILQARTADYRLLFANLGDSDAGAVMAWLKERKIPYRLEQGGKAISIPADKVDETRLELAGAGLPQGGGVGFEVFDRQSFGLTDFAQKINYQRALQGELARTIASLAPVEAARVHLALSEKRLFRDQQKESTASVIVKLAPGAGLKETQIQGIIHLVAGSIEGLEAQNVTVVDSTGRILSRMPGEETVGPATPGMLEYQQTLERRLESRAQSLLDRAVGPGNALVRVTATVDFLQQEQTEERYDPEGVVIRSEQSVQERSGGEVAGGVPGVKSNLPGGQGAAAGTATVRTEETINYETSKVVSRKVFPVGTVKQLSVAVLLADRPPVAGSPEGTATPRSESDLRSIENLVRDAIGLDSARGDKITVSSLPFENIFSTDALPEPSKATDLYPWLPFIRYGALLLAAALLYFLLLKPLLRTVQGERRIVTPLKTVEELEMEMVAESQERALARANDPGSRLRRQVIEEQAPYAQVIKSWLKEG